MSPWMKHHKLLWQQENPMDDYRAPPGEFICLNKEHGYACKSFAEHVQYRAPEPERAEA